MIELLQQILSGLAMGAIYASLALALSVVYQSTHHVNFAQGEMATMSTFVAATLIDHGFPFWAAFVITVLVSFVAAVVLERTVLRPLQHAPALSVTGVFVGLLILFSSLNGLFFGHTIRQFPSPVPAEFAIGRGLIGAHQLWVIVTVLIVLAVVWAFFRFTSLGLGMRSAAYNPVSSRLCGIDADAMLALGWGLAASLGALAGILVAPLVYLDVNMMSGVLLYGFAGALLGGIRSTSGAVLGGFVIGVLENLLGAYVIPAELKFSLALALIVVVLVWKPDGLLGRRIVTRV